MGGEDHGRPGRCPLADQGLEPLLVNGVQARKGFVQDQEVRVVDQGADQGHLLGHALRKPSDLCVERGAEAKSLQEGSRLLACSLRGNALERAEEARGLQGRHPGMETPLLRQEADAIAHAPAVHRAQNIQSARGRRDQSQDHPQGGGLSGAVGAQESEDGPSLYPETQAVDHGPVPEAPGHLGQLQGGCRGHAGSLRVHPRSCSDLGTPAIGGL